MSGHVFYWIACTLITLINRYEEIITKNKLSVRNKSSAAMHMEYMCALNLLNCRQMCFFFCGLLLLSILLLLDFDVC